MVNRLEGDEVDDDLLDGFKRLASLERPTAAEILSRVLLRQRRQVGGVLRKSGNELAKILYKPDVAAQLLDRLGKRPFDNLANL